MIDLSSQQLVSLIQLIVSSQPDELDCDGCFELIAEFADYQTQQRPLSQTLEKVERHLTQCACCKYEYEALLAAIDVDDDSLSLNRCDR